MADHQFGGSWTERKLEALRGYLEAYQTIFTANPRAKTLETIYVDAFAGTGERDAGDDPAQPRLFGYDEESRRYQDGSVRIALSLEKKFQRYVFLDTKQEHVDALRQLVAERYPAIAAHCQIERADANAWLQNWCRTEHWHKQRAVVFLDPYGMSVEWRTLEAIAATQAIDLWVLFPLGIGASRVLPTETPPDGPWADRLTKLFGTSAWRERFYRRRSDEDLFGGSAQAWTKIGSVDAILAFFLERLREVFARIVEHPLILENSRRSPMYALCFAAGNPRGAVAAVRIASHLTRA
jgi:three-Cys-motif partner protein